MALAHRTRQSGNVTTRWPITVLLSNDSGTEHAANSLITGHQRRSSKQNIFDLLLLKLLPYILYYD